MWDKQVGIRQSTKISLIIDLSPPPQTVGGRSYASKNQNFDIVRQLPAKNQKIGTQIFY